MSATLPESPDVANADANRAGQQTAEPSALTAGVGLDEPFAAPAAEDLADSNDAAVLGIAQSSRIYGWVIVMVAAGAMVATLPGRTHGLGMITERLLADPGFQSVETVGPIQVGPLNRTLYADINLFATLLGALFCLPCGWLIDRFGLRFVLTGILLALAAVVYSMTLLTGISSLFVAITLTRGFGQSALSVISITMVGKWFPRRSGLPMAVYTLILSCGFGGAMYWAEGYVNEPWQILWAKLSVGLLFFAPLALLLTCNPPVPPTTATTMTEPETATNRDYTLSQALATPAFWVFGLAISVYGLIAAGVSLFNESILVQQGFDKTVYYKIFALSPIVGLLCHLPMGWLVSRLPNHKLLALALAILTMALAGLPAARNMAHIYAYTVAMGMAGSALTVLFFSFWGQAYGQSHLGHIQGAAQMMTVLASAVGPKILADSFAITGSYHTAIYSLAATVAILALWAWFVPLPPRMRANQMPLFAAVGTGASDETITQVRD